MLAYFCRKRTEDEEEMDQMIEDICGDTDSIVSDMIGETDASKHSLFPHTMTFLLLWSLRRPQSSHSFYLNPNIRGTVRPLYNSHPLDSIKVAVAGR